MHLMHDLIPACDVELARSIRTVFNIANRAAVDAFLLAEPTYALPILSAAHQIRCHDRRARIIALRTRDSISSPFHLFRLGVFSVLQSDCTVGELVRAVTEVRTGKPYIGARVQKVLAADLFAHGKPHLALNHREFEAMSLLIRGFSASETACRLAISAQTVSAYKASIRRQLNLKGLSAMVRYGIEHGLLEKE